MDRVHKESPIIHNNTAGVKVCRCKKKKKKKKKLSFTMIFLLSSLEST